MTPELGLFALILALAVALVQGSVPVIGAARGKPGWMAVAEPAAIAQFVCVAVAFGTLIWAYVVSDFTVATVAANSNSTIPLLYKITGAWGNHEGSMVLWVQILTLFGAAVALFGRNLPPSLRARTLGVQAWISIGFLSFTILTSNPFARVFPPPADGNDLNPLLQDPGLAFHPPMLYTGYVGFSIVFAFAVAALLEGRVDAAWARWVRPWTLAAWCFLTAGIALGSWWAYYELGWGGWWFWDPVENISFMPWLVGTALLHSAIVVEKRNALKAWTILLAILTFSLSLIGTFVVRSGLITSVHSFAVDPSRGLYILLLLAVAIGGSLLLFAIRAPVLKPGGLFAPVSREGGLVLNNLLLATAAATVFIGTLYPLFLEALGGGRVSVGPPFYNLTFVPLMMPLVLVMGAGLLLPWKRADLAGLLGRLKVALALAVAAALVALWLYDGTPIMPILWTGLIVWLVAGTLTEWAERVRLFRAPLAESWRRARLLPRSAYGATVAHLGLAIAIAGMVGAGSFKQESVEALSPGQSIDLAGYHYLFKDVERVQGPNWVADQGTFEVTRPGPNGAELVTTLQPQRRFYPVTRRNTTEAAIHTTGFADLYAVIGDPAENKAGAWVVRIYQEPMVPWLWVGALTMMLGGLLSLSDRRLRVGAPRRAVRAPALVQPAE
ncbi:cytochrome c-type biogenesis protein CcmF [Tistlia consotensis]|uniref:Cytochrome c-type biogenesis protein CcmF n=1 Tax=Tistlia consotensis USBA 355 TaxID=560819 RepID=A0A1Y6BMX7_9PROT|nr:heme lyase CcmF/NrfE family subunit [Tistlia consotensis]SMF11832.1 cytochrome c-type biogenesis protein CcmF [Tistlia consotensis USBA 355]SNR51620.1 cytochrome c-type biogenesis protein CcmF [Tistlia consotensis]